MPPLRTIALVVALGAGAVLYPLVAPTAQPGGVETARKALAAGDYASAITLYTSVLQSERLDATLLAAIYQERGAARHKSGSPVTAIADYTNSIWLGVLPDPLLARSFLDRGIAYVEVGELIRARRDFDNAIAKDPHLADAYFGRATVLRLLGKPQEALADYDEALRLGHDQAHLVLYGRGLAREMLGDRSRAAADFSQAAVREPGFVAAKARVAALGAPPPSEEEIQAYALSASRKMPGRREPVSPVASITLADAGEILTLAGTPAEEPTGALPATAPPTVLASAQPPGPAPNPSFLRPSRDALLAEQAVEANNRAGEPNPAGIAEAETPTGAIPNALPEAAPPPPAEAPAAPKEAAIETPPPLAQEPVQPETTQPPQVAQPGAEAAAPAPKAKPAEASGRFFIQLGAYTDRAIAERGMAGFKSRFPEVSTKHETAVEPAKVAGRGTIYRVRLGPLASEAETRALCDTLRRSAQACVPVFPPKPPR